MPLSYSSGRLTYHRESKTNLELALFTRGINSHNEYHKYDHAETFLSVSVGQRGKADVSFSLAGTV